MENDTEISFPTPVVAWTTLAILFLAYISSFVDRMIISLLVEPIKADFQISDTQISLLLGLSFAIFYCLAALPIGRLVDIWSRKKIITVGITLWSFMTALCGLAQNYTQLFLARIGVGVGEASLAPAAYSMLADSFPPKKLGLAMGVFTMGTAVGAGLALIIGGAIISFVTGENGENVSLFGISFLSGWQWVFVLVGLPGLFIALLTSLIREPDRIVVEEKKKLYGDISIPISEVKNFFKRNLDFYIPHHFAVGCSNLALVGINSWVSVYFMRIHGWTISEAGFNIGIALILGGVLGLIIGGWLSDKISVYIAGGKAYFCLICAVLAIPSAIFFATEENAFNALVFFALSYSFMVAPIAPAAAMLQEITPNRMRGMLSAFYLLIVSLIGLALGPLIVAFLNDTYFGGGVGIQKALLISIPVFNLLAATFYFVLIKPYCARCS
ncbi:MAG: MFS transporter [Porticoccaceae bacterium]|jgi:MFS family permease|nr:MFS transporter [Porticoccaceae bacterium]